jgi:hypothetical protein
MRATMPVGHGRADGLIQIISIFGHKAFLKFELLMRP